VRPEGANHQWRKIPRGELSIKNFSDGIIGQPSRRTSGLDQAGLHTAQKTAAAFALAMLSGDATVTLDEHRSAIGEPPT
jgi:hypothetical protein